MPTRYKQGKFTLYAPGERRDSVHWIARFTAHGRQQEISIPIGSKREAARIARQLVQAERDAPKDEATPRTFAEAADLYADARNADRRTRKWLERLKGELGHMLLEDVMPGNIQAAANKLYPGTLPSSKNRAAIVPAAAVLHHAAADGRVEYRKVEKLKEAAPETRRPDDAVVAALLSHSEGAMHVALTFLFHQGWRITEMLSLLREHVHLEQRELVAFVSKSGVWKPVPMHEAVHDALAPWLEGLPEGRERVFPWRDRWTFYDDLNPLKKALGVEFTPHQARHWFGSSLGDTGASSRDLTDVGTWTDPKSTQRYNRSNREHGKQVMSRLKIRAKEGSDDASS